MKLLQKLQGLYKFKGLIELPALAPIIECQSYHISIALVVNLVRDPHYFLRRPQAAKIPRYSDCSQPKRLKVPWKWRCCQQNFLRVCSPQGLAHLAHCMYLSSRCSHVLFTTTGELHVRYIAFQCYRCQMHQLHVLRLGIAAATMY